MQTSVYRRVSKLFATRHLGKLSCEDRDDYGPGQLRQNGPMRQHLRAATTHASIPGWRHVEIAAGPRVMAGEWGAGQHLFPQRNSLQKVSVLKPTRNVDRVV